MQRRPNERSYTVAQVCKMINSGKITFENPLQRAEDQWKIENKSLLIDSLLRTTVPDIYALNSMNKNNRYNRGYDIIDGKQRLTVISSYINNKWALRKLDPIQLESTGEIYNISGKKFSELPEDVKEEIKSFSLGFKIFELDGSDGEDKFVEELFYRLNIGKAQAKEHLALVKAKLNIKDFARRIVDTHKLFTEIAYFTSAGRKNSVREMTIMQSIMLLSGLNYKTFRNEDVQTFFSENEISEKTLALCEKTFTDIAKIFPEFNKQITKINIPILTYIISNISNENKNQIYSLIKQYFNKDARKGDKYNSFCGRSSAQKSFIKGRINTLQKICNIQIDQAAK